MVCVLEQGWNKTLQGCGPPGTEFDTPALHSVLCSSVQPKTEQLACFARTFAVALELVHRCGLRKHNGGTIGGNLQIKERLYYNKIPFLRHGGSEI